jgi:eukaryotic-like serine/threonine-protein kinase
MAASKLRRIIFSALALCIVGCTPAAQPATAVATSEPSATVEIVSSLTSELIAIGPDVTHYQADPQRTAAYTFTAIRALPKVKWEKRMPASSSLGSPLYADDVLYVSSQNGRLYAFDAETGEEHWSAAVGQLPASVAIAGDIVFVNDLNNTANAIHRETGETIWSVPIQGSGWGAPLVVDETVFVVSERGVYAFEALTGSTIWKVESGEHKGFIGSPSYADGILCFGQGGNFFALDAATGKELWKHEVETWFYSSAISNGTVYAGNDDAQFHAYDLQTGEELWHTESKGAGWSAPVIANQTIYVGNIDQHLYAFDAETGEELWSFEAVDWAVSDPVVSDGVVYFGVGNHDNREGARPLYALDAKTGQELWQFEADSRLMTAPALSDARMYIVTIQGRLYALE